MIQRYRCVYYDATGKPNSVILSSESESELIRSFANEGKTLVSIASTYAENKQRENTRRNQDALLQFTEMIGVLLDSGLTLKESLEISATVRGKNRIHTISGKMLEMVNKGISFSKAIENASDFFPPIYQGMIRVGERIGSVESIFPRLSEYLRDRKALKEKIASALAYPIMVLFVAVLGTVATVLFAIPKMESIFIGFGGNAADQIRHNISLMKIAFTIIIALAFIISAILVFLLIAGKKSWAARKRIDRAKLRIPISGSFAISMETLNFSFAMETLSAGGVSIEDAIKEAALVVSNFAYKDALAHVHEDLLKGKSLSQAFGIQSVFPDYFQQWITIGERSGKAENVFSQIRSFYQSEVDKKTSRLMTLIEPTLIAFIGAFLICIIIAVVIPLFTMYGSLL